MAQGVAMAAIRMGFGLAALAAACADPGAGAGSAAREESRMTDDAAGDGKEVAQLPFAHGRSFATLDDYLAHLRQYAGPVGQPWYREIRPGVYERVTSMRTDGEPETFTRAQLMERFGFSR
jgi:hypothetical protein